MVVDTGDKRPRALSLFSRKLIVVKQVLKHSYFVFFYETPCIYRDIRPPVRRASPNPNLLAPSGHSSSTKRPQHNSNLPGSPPTVFYKLQKNGKDRQEKEGTRYSIT